MNFFDEINILLTSVWSPSNFMRISFKASSAACRNTTKWRKRHEVNFPIQHISRNGMLIQIEYEYGQSDLYRMSDWDVETWPKVFYSKNLSLIRVFAPTSICCRNSDFSSTVSTTERRSSIVIKASEFLSQYTDLNGWSKQLRMEPFSSRMATINRNIGIFPSDYAIQM